MIEVAPRLAEKGVDLLICQSGINHRKNEADFARANVYRAGSHQTVEAQRGRECGQGPSRSIIMSRSADNARKYALWRIWACSPSPRVPSAQSRPWPCE